MLIAAHSQMYAWDFIRQQHRHAIDKDKWYNGIIMSHKQITLFPHTHMKRSCNRYGSMSRVTYTKHAHAESICMYKACNICQTVDLQHLINSSTYTDRGYQNFLQYLCHRMLFYCTNHLQLSKIEPERAATFVTMMWQSVVHKRKCVDGPGSIATHLNVRLLSPLPFSR